MEFQLVEVVMIWPLTKVRKPRRTSKIRNYLVKPEVVRDILRVTELRGRIEIHIIDLCHFLVSTGARLGEVLHAEWQDFNLTKGIWRIVHKPECPTSDGLVGIQNGKNLESLN